jgi:peptidoglycan/LPS O-acetylase OafA/YrhL
MNRIRGLDSIRAFLALWVAMNHVIKPPLSAGIDASSRLGWLLEKTYSLTINGQAAVIGFFLISGFCVHLPYRKTGPTNVLAYYLRRHIRVAVPFVVVLVLTQFLPENLANLERGIFWSVYAELIYYTLYPFIFRLQRRIGWNALIALSCLLAPIVLFANHPNGNYHDAGDELAWILGLPCWLLGCRLAEQFDRPRSPVGHLEIWRWRLTVWVVSVICYFLRFHTPIKHYYSLDIFAVLVYFWLDREIRFFMNVAPLRFMEKAGGWSYSLYLTHFFAATLYLACSPYLPDFFGAKRNADWTLAESRTFLDWLVRCIFVFATAYGFHLAVERPAHQIARRLAKRVSKHEEVAPGESSTPLQSTRPEVERPKESLLTAVVAEEP